MSEPDLSEKKSSLAQLGTEKLTENVQQDQVPESVPEEMTKVSGVRRLSWLALSCCLLLTGLALTTSGLVCWSLHSPPQDRFLILLDAGSVHTSVYTYRYSFTEPANVSVRETHFCELGEVGISSFQDNPRQAARFVSDSGCVRDSVDRIPQDRRPLSRLELLSTAGMRVVRLKSPAVAEQILGNLTQQLGLVGDMEAEADILSGLEEAVAGWVTSLRLSERVVGALDWGGASSQLTVPDSGDSEASRQVTLSGRQFSVRPQSHLCYGQSESLKRHRARLVVRRLSEGDLGAAVEFNISDPCLPSGLSTPPVSLPSLFSSPCTRLSDSDLLLALTSSPANVTFSSSSDYQQCSGLIQDQFRPELCQQTWQPLEGEVTCLEPLSLPPPSNLTYLAMSTYWYLTTGLGLSQGVSLQDFLQKTRQVCSLNISAAREELKKAANTACYQSLLMYHLLTTGYHFNSSTWQQIQFVKRLNNTEVGWGLGYATIQANSLPAEPAISLAVMIVLVVSGLLLLLLSLAPAGKALLSRDLYSRLREHI